MEWVPGYPTEYTGLKESIVRWVCAVRALPEYASMAWKNVNIQSTCCNERALRARAVCLAERVGSDERDGLCVVHAHATEGVAHRDLQEDQQGCVR